MPLDLDRGRTISWNKRKVTRGNLLAFVLWDLRLLLCYDYTKFLILVFRQNKILGKYILKVVWNRFYTMTVKIL